MMPLVADNRLDYNVIVWMSSASVWTDEIIGSEFVPSVFVRYIRCLQHNWTLLCCVAVEQTSR